MRKVVDEFARFCFVSVLSVALGCAFEDVWVGEILCCWELLYCFVRALNNGSSI